jgi:hypothetical protein
MGDVERVKKDYKIPETFRGQNPHSVRVSTNQLQNYKV